jgi:tetratricopeptide (TPR) repeat protein
VSQHDPEFERFSRELDREWVRRRLRSAFGPALESQTDEDAIARALEEADPLGPAARTGWLSAIREALAAWPARLVFAACACALLFLGIALGRISSGRPGHPAGIVPPKPAYTAEAPQGLGIAPSTREGAERKFREAMAFYAAPDFPRKALPLLRASVQEDPSSDEAQFWLGVVLLLDGRSAEAVEPLEKAVSLAGASARYKHYLLFAYLQTGAVEKATALAAELLGSR